MITLEFDNQLPFIDSLWLIIDLALYSNYAPMDSPPFRSISDVIDYLHRRGVTLPQCADESGDYSTPPKYFYNLIGPTWHVRGGSVSRVDPKTGEQKTIISGAGQYHTANYWAKFEQSFADFAQALVGSNHELLFSAFSKGQAAIENLLNSQDIEGIKGCSVEDKLEKIYLKSHPTGNWQEERNREPWASFLKLKTIRNNFEVHNKEMATGFTYDEILSHFNLYVPAIGKTLFELHKLINIKCPPSIIRASYHPKITMRMVDPH